SKELKNSGFSGTVVICDEPEDKKIKEVLPEGLEEGSDEERVYSAIQKKGSSIPKILKKLSYELSEDSVERILATLEERGFVKAWTKGKSRLYFKSKDYNERMNEEI
ncbi:MAG: BlaI/MecI/CopY family transcriptional regulator, partial [Leptolyngbyaceae cyanobacterium HOT.MB2.61]|nr:BlaI/MecI/CopY family transcriptional regulator [Leptolyngbyaceae cyanobacterium HOT.MB2.61]